MNNIAFLTTIYPINELYITEFFESLINQTIINFDVIIVNDGYADFDKLKKTYHSLHIIELPGIGCIAKNREALIKHALFCGYHTAIFGDIDDYFDRQRVEVVELLLKNNDIVINDLTAFNQQKLTHEHIFSSRIDNLAEIPSDLIIDRNIFGLSNTAIKLQEMTAKDISFPSKLIAVDWYFFSNLLLNNKKAIFTNDTITYYRQHDSNTAGIGTINASTILKAIKVKLIHYHLMIAKDEKYQLLYDQTKQLALWLENEKNLTEYVRVNVKHIHSPFWWETMKLGNICELNL